jgi:hypothetical protein
MKRVNVWVVHLQLNHDVDDTQDDIVNKAKLVHIFSYYVYFFSLHVSGDYVPIIRRNNCFYVTLGICHSVWMTVWYAGYTRHSSTQSNNYQVSHRNSYFSWWWAHSHPKHVEKRNKHTKKNCAPSWLYLEDYTRITVNKIEKNPGR